MRRSPPRSPPKSKNPSTKIPENIRDPSRTFREHSSPSCPPCPLLEQKTLGDSKRKWFSILAKEELINSSKDLECGGRPFPWKPCYHSIIRSQAVHTRSSAAGGLFEISFRNQAFASSILQAHARGQSHHPVSVFSTPPKKPLEGHARRPR